MCVRGFGEVTKNVTTQRSGSEDILSAFQAGVSLEQSLKSKPYSGINPPEHGQDAHAPRKRNLASEKLPKNVQQLNMTQVDNQNTQWTFQLDIIHVLSLLLNLNT